MEASILFRMTKWVLLLLKFLRKAMVQKVWYTICTSKSDKHKIITAWNHLPCGTGQEKAGRVSSSPKWFCYWRDSGNSPNCLRVSTGKSLWPKSSLPVIKNSEVQSFLPLVTKARGDCLWEAQPGTPTSNSENLWHYPQKNRCRQNTSAADGSKFLCKQTKSIGTS